MIRPGIYIYTVNDKKIFISPPISGYGEISVLYKNFEPVSCKEIQTQNLAETKKSKATN